VNVSPPPRVLARLAAAVVLFLAACGGPSRAPDQAPPILLVSDRGGSCRIYEEIDKGTARAVGSAESGGPHADTMPARLPDGGIVFVSDRDGGPGIYLAPPRGGVRRLTSDSGPAEVAAPAPLGRDRIVFAGVEAGAPKDAPRDLYTMRLDGGDLRRLTRHPADDADPWGTADGRAVVFVSDRAGAARVWLIPDVAATDPEAGAVCLSETGPQGAPDSGGTGDFADHGPVPLPDGSIVFAREPAGRVSQIFQVSREGARAGLRQITDPLTLPYGASEPVVLDERTILLVAGPMGGREQRSGGGRFAVYRIALGGFNLARVTRDQVPYSDFTRRLGACPSNGMGRVRGAATTAM
jgi:Tol biopolymer transport system component